MRWLKRGMIAVMSASLMTSALAVFPSKTETGYRSVGMLGSLLSDGSFRLSGGGTAISPDWVVSVAHVGGSVYVQDGVRYPVERKYIHTSDDGNADLALFKLANPCRYVSPVRLAPFDGPSGTFRLKGRTAFMVGYGRTAAMRSDGTGWQQLLGSEGVKRSATNRIDDFRQIEVNIGTVDNPKIKKSWTLVYDLDRPGDQSFSTLGTSITDREGGIAQKDSGSAWFVIADSTVWLVAVSESVAVPDGTELQDPYRFGGQGIGVHLGSYQSWIYDVTGLPDFASSGSRLPLYALSWGANAGLMR